MAVVKMGALVTEIKGSIGGTAFKLQRGTQVMYKKSSGASKSKLLKNQSLVYSRFIFTAWSSLTDTEKNNWAAQAAILFFPDKFGNQRHITARQLYSKCNLNLRDLNYISEPPAGFNTSIVSWTLSNTVIDIVAQEALLRVNPVTSVGVWVNISCEVVLGQLNAPTFIKRKILKSVFVTSNTLIDFWNEFILQFPYITADYKVRYYVEGMNEYGFKGLTSYIEATVS